MAKRQTATKKKVVEKSTDPVTELVLSEETEEFPDGFAWFACNQRFYGQFIVDGVATPTGRTYEIQRTGTKVDIKDVEFLRELKSKVWCPREQQYLEIKPIGLTSK